MGKLFEDETWVEQVPPSSLALDALRVMLEKRYSQLPVVDGERVLGVFSLWSLAKLLSDHPDLVLEDLVVEDAMEKLPIVTVRHSLHDVISLIRRHEAVLVGTERQLQAIATPIDVLAYLYRVSRTFVLLGEIEFALRAAIQRCTNENEKKLAECIEASVAKKYQALEQAIPSELHEMTFEDYRMIITSGDNWPLFEGMFGRNRALVGSRLKRVREIRNDALHFRQEVTTLEYDTLVATRDWLLRKLQKERIPQGARAE